ncbi:stellacyanin-like [Vigna unguiculata]|uniref:Multicopper oxidase n=1 Tax=Vigna unguiculata TaxID=3917 RepID=A0A4D6L9M1_VIGUN|nr:stellacyanin-like [Vigna unguiculata]QCD85105.1 Multicopper oxidase [Vigna unguiculata]
MSVKMKLGLLVFGTIGSMLLEFVSCKTVHIVGDQLGWNIPTQQTFYDDWAKKKAFVVGDQLVFQYHPGLNTVVMVNKEDYEHCSTRNVLHTYFKGNSSVTLEKVGDYYFFSSVGKHCEAGMKLHVTVTNPLKSSQ